MLKCQKDLFSLPANETYLNGAYMSPLMKSAKMAGRFELHRKSNPATYNVQEDFFDIGTEVKQLFAKLINCKDHERIALISAVSYGIATVTRNIRAEKGQKIVMVEEQFPSNYYSWERLAVEQALTIQMVEAPKNSSHRAAAWNARILEQIDTNTAVVTLPQVHWADGTLFDLVAIGEKARAVGALLIIDGTQSVGAFPFDIAKIQPDALICGSYKWLMGFYGIGLAYYGEYFDNGVPIEENWVNRLDSENFQNLVNYQPQYKPKANRYCRGQSWGMLANVCQKTALQQILAWNVDNIQSYCAEITDEAISRLVEMGCQIEEKTHRAKHLFGIRLPDGIDLEAIKKACLDARIIVSFRGNAIRVSPHVYNTAADMSKLVDVLEKVINKVT